MQPIHAPEWRNMLRQCTAAPWTPPRERQHTKAPVPSLPAAERRAALALDIVRLASGKPCGLVRFDQVRDAFPERSKTFLFMTLRAACDDGLLERVERGIYRVVPGAERAAAAACAAAATTSQYEAVLQVIEAAGPSGIVVAQIIEAMRAPKSTLSSTLDRLLDKRAVVRIRRGHYVATKFARNA